MDTSPKILFWGFNSDEKDRFNKFLQGLAAPQTVVIDPDQGHLLVHEILFSDKREEEPLDSDEKIMFFFNVPAEVIHKIMNEAKKKELPLPIFAMVTRENISWKFSDLVDHLKKEHEFVQKKLKEKKRRKN
ncbi:MAG: DUF3783 domain-containing protein [Desulfomonilia bacterium]|jgi:hypothetical protein